MAELDALDPVPEQVKLTSGTVVQLEQLRSRQFFKLLRIITNGALPVVQDLSFFRMDGISAEDFGIRLMTLMALAIPNAENSTIEFLRSMCKPVGLIEGRQLNKADQERNDTLLTRLDEELDNPELDDLITLVEAIVRRESSDIQALGKRLMAMFKLAEKTGQLPPSPSQASPGSTSSADSADPATSSPASTDGETTKSLTSPSPARARSSRRSANDASTSNGDKSNG